MQSRAKNPKLNPDKKRAGLGLASEVAIFLGILLVNASWFFYSFLGGNYWPVAVISIFISVLLIILIIFKSLETNRSLGEREKKTESAPENQEQPGPATNNKNKELLEANEKLRKMKDDFLKTTQDLFQRETELVQVNKRLRGLDAIKSEFVSVAAHQLRTPLTGIKWSYLTLLEKKTGLLNPEQTKIVKKGLEAIDYAIDTINDLLNTARLEEGKSTLNLEEQPIGPVIQEILKQHEPVIKEKKIKLNVDIPLSSPLSLKFDKEKISIVFDNILANAIKYTPEGGTIGLKVFREKDKIKFKIEDSGIGIPKGELGKVFSKFFRAKNAVSFQTSGSGLGLYVAKNIVEKHGGNISLESEENSGTMVTFTLPVK